MNIDILDTIGITTIIDTLFHNTKKQDKYHAEEVRPHGYKYRPQTLNEYIGQDKAKELVGLTIQKINNNIPCHILISGTKGHGKTTLAQLIAKELNFNITYYIAGSFTLKNLLTFLEQNETSKSANVLFIDEIHALDKEVAEFLYPILEDFILPNGKGTKLRPFIFIGATTDKNVLARKYAPFIDRCGTDILLEHYSEQNIVSILKQYNKKVYKENIVDEIFYKLAENTRYTPRIAMNWFDDYIICKDIDRVLRIHRIVRNSLTDIDIKVLEHLAEIQKPIGLEALAIIAQVTRSDFATLIEPFLIQQGYVSRTSRGRLITQKGIKLLEELK